MAYDERWSGLPTEEAFLSAETLLDAALPLVESGSIRAWAKSQREVWLSIAGAWLNPTDRHRATFDKFDAQLFAKRPGEPPEHRFAAYIVATAIGML